MSGKTALSADGKMIIVGRMQLSQNTNCRKCIYKIKNTDNSNNLEKIP